jgi:hypothetical protein
VPLIRQKSRGLLIRPRYVAERTLLDRNNLEAFPEEPRHLANSCPLNCGVPSFDYHWELDEHLRVSHPGWVELMVEELGLQ